MKKSLIILLVLGVLLTLGLASCKNEVQAPADELVSVSFEQAVSRSLTATVQDFNKDDYYWYYAAEKTDSTGLISGQTASYGYAGAEAVNPNGKGLGTVTGFSQGGWKFKLFAYAERPTTSAAKAAFIYTGEALGITLRKNGGEGNQVSVTVSPATTGNGILFVDMAHIELDEEATASHNTVPGSVTVTKGGESYLPESGTNVEYDLSAGQYTVTVEFTDGDIVFATGMVIATVYPGLKTTVTGDVAELITYAEFDAKRNPDIIMTTAGSDEIPAGSPSTNPIALVDEATEKRVSASVPADAAQKLIPAGASSMTLALNVDTTDSTSTSVTYDISMYKTIVTASEAETSKVNSVSKIVTVTIKLSKGLSGVKVTHSGADMDPLTSKDQDAEGYFYDDSVSTADYATLYIKTKSFSPFAVSYDAIDGVAQLGKKKYATLEDAFKAAVESEKKSTIYLLKDASGKGIFLAPGLNADITVDLGGHKYTCTGPAVGSTGTESQAWHLEKNNKVTIKSGTLDCTSNAGVLMLIQNYCDLTLQDVAVDGTKLPGTGRYVLSGNNGDILITGKTDITAKTGDYAFDVCYTGYYPDGVRYVFDENYTGTVTGTIQLDVWGTLPVETNCSLTIKAGTFDGSFDIQSVLSQHAIDDSHISGGRFKVNMPQDYIEDGYMVKDGGDGYYYVVPVVAKIGDKYYASVAAAVAASEAGDTVIVLRDTVETSTINVNKNITIKGADSENLILVRKNSDRLFNITTSATIKDLSLYASDEPIYVRVSSVDVVNLKNLRIDSGFKSIHVLSGGTVNVEDCISSGVYPTNLNVAIPASVTYNATNSEFYGWISWGTGTKEITFTNCSFGKGHGYAFVRPYVSTTFINCTFADVVKMDSAGDGGIISFDQCSIGETSIVDEASLLQLLYLNPSDPDSFHTGKKAWVVNGTTIFDDREPTN